MEVEETVVQKRSREMFLKELNAIQKKAYSSILDFVEVRVGDFNLPENKPVRARILRASNDAIRQLEQVLKNNYVMEYVSTLQDVLVVGQK